MAILNITYFERLARDEQGNIVPVGELPAAGGQALTFTTSTASAAIPKRAQFVRLLADADCYIDIDPTPVATVNSTPKLEANVAEYFGLNTSKTRAGTLKIAAYDGSS